MTGKARSPGCECQFSGLGSHVATDRIGRGLASTFSDRGTSVQSRRPDCQLPLPKSIGALFAWGAPGLAEFARPGNDCERYFVRAFLTMESELARISGMNDVIFYTRRD